MTLSTVAALGIEVLHLVELEAGELQHPHLRQVAEHRVGGRRRDQHDGRARRRRAAWRGLLRRRRSRRRALRRRAPRRRRRRAARARRCRRARRVRAARRRPRSRRACRRRATSSSRLGGLDVAGTSASTGISSAASGLALAAAFAARASARAALAAAASALACAAAAACGGLRRVGGGELGVELGLVLGGHARGLLVDRVLRGLGGGFLGVDQRLRRGLLGGLDVGHGLRGDRGGERVQHRRADVAGHGHAAAGALDQLAGERRRGRLAVGAGDGQDLRRVAALGLQLRERLRRTGRARRAPARWRRCAACSSGAQARVGRAQARALVDAGDAVQRLGRQLAGEERAARDLGGQRRGLRRVRARVPHANARALAGAPARHGQARGAQPQDQHVLVGEIAHARRQRSFRLARPTRHSSIVTIQKRITTCVSVQPDFSKWWCSGAIFRMRRPSPYLRFVYLK